MGSVDGGTMTAWRIVDETLPGAAAKNFSNKSLNTPGRTLSRSLCTLSLATLARRLRASSSGPPRLLACFLASLQQYGRDAATIFAELRISDQLSSLCAHPASCTKTVRLSCTGCFLSDIIVPAGARHRNRGQPRISSGFRPSRTFVPLFPSSFLRSLISCALPRLELSE